MSSLSPFFHWHCFFFFDFMIGRDVFVKKKRVKNTFKLQNWKNLAISILKIESVVTLCESKYYSKKNAFKFP